MKKIFLAASLIMASLTFAGTTNVMASRGEIETEGGRHIAESRVPASILSAFYAKYPSATNVSWEVEREHGQKVYKVDFRFNGKRMTARFFA